MHNNNAFSRTIISWWNLNKGQGFLVPNRKEKPTEIFMFCYNKSRDFTPDFWWVHVTRIFNFLCSACFSFWPLYWGCFAIALSVLWSTASDYCFDIFHFFFKENTELSNRKKKHVHTAQNLPWFLDFLWCLDGSQLLWYLLFPTKA